MRICSIVTSLTSGGAETLVANLSEEFTTRGHRSLVIALCDAETLGNAADAESRLKSQIIKAGGQFQSLALPASRPILAGNFAMRRALRSFRPDVIHTHTARALLMMLARQQSAPVVLTHHNSVLGFPSFLFRVFDRIASGYVAISQETHRMLEELVHRPVTQIVNAAGRNFKQAKPRTGLSTPLRILSVGTISDQKNYPLLIETARVMRDSKLIDPLPKMLIAGNGAELGTLRARVAQEGLQDSVSFLGERSDVRELMASADLYLNTSRYEGLPIALLEAMNMGLPIVATEVAGNRELVSHGQSGLLAAESPTHLAEAIARLACDERLYKELSCGALGRAGEFSITKAASKHLQLYQKLFWKRSATPTALSEWIS